MEQIITNLMVTDMRKSLEFYCNLLGFKLSMGVTADRQMFTDGTLRDDLVFAVLKQGPVELMLQLRDSLAEDVPVFSAHDTPCGTFTLYIRGKSIDDLADHLAETVEIIKGPETTWYGMRELYVRDPDGYVLAFGAPEGQPPA